MLTRAAAAVGASLVVALSLVLPAAAPVSLTSPDGQLALVVEVTSEGRLTWKTTMGGKPVIEPSPLGIVVDGIDLGTGAEIGGSERYKVDEKYPWRGVHAIAVKRANGTRLALKHRASGTS